MNVIHAFAELDAGSRKVCLAIGFFDGVHLGHQHILRQTISDATHPGAVSVAVTFDRHPNEIVAPARVPPLIYPLSKKLRVLASLGVDAACVLRFDKPLSQKSGEQFSRDLAAGFKRIESISVGRAFNFGHGRSGNVELLKSVGQELDFRVHAAAELTLDGEPVSSTRVRELVAAGDFDLAGQMLGRPYSLVARVVKGAGMGRQLGFPTANLDGAGLLTPPVGVYAARAEAGGRTCRAAVNIGRRPTVEPAALHLQIEAHLLDFHADLLGQELEITFARKLRDEQKFPSLSALREQIARDVALVRHLPDGEKGSLFP
jgi:riboflavin kinase / FMN adenylyltransferase